MTPQDEKIKRMMKRGIDSAFTAHFSKLMTNWVIDDVQQPARAAKGAFKAIEIYREAMAAVEAWEG